MYWYCSFICNLAGVRVKFSGFVSRLLVLGEYLVHLYSEYRLLFTDQYDYGLNNQYKACSLSTILHSQKIFINPSTHDRLALRLVPLTLFVAE